MQLTEPSIVAQVLCVNRHNNLDKLLLCQLISGSHSEDVILVWKLSARRWVNNASMIVFQDPTVGVLKFFGSLLPQSMRTEMAIMVKKHIVGITFWIQRRLTSRLRRFVGIGRLGGTIEGRRPSEKPSEKAARALSILRHFEINML
jgi:hypothetical protein